MTWDEFCDLLSGLGADTPLGRIVSIRAEENKDILKHFTSEQLRIRREWRERQVKEVGEEQLKEFLNNMEIFFVSMAK